ncbi:phage tail tip fiber protein [Aeromonas caviae]|uniref:phage tail tip fiber protein n=1 Tax=Aeromonas caviae TaxID=648 RepID=UPI0038CFE754
MPAVAIPVIAGVAAGAGSSLVVSTATAIAIGTAVASATMMITAKKPSLGDYRSASERSQILRAAASDKTCIYGRVVSSGLMSFAAEQKGEQEEGEWLHVALVISGHKLSRIGDIWLGDDLIGTFGDLVSYELHVDRQTCDPFMLANCADWQDDMIGQGITWLRISFKFDAEKFPAGLPNIKIEKFGKEVWDPRDGQWKHSRNAALVILDYYRTWLSVPDDELRLDEFVQAANICDELVAIPGGGTEPRYSLDVEFDLGEARVKVLEAMHMACAAQPTYVGGKHGIIAGAYYGPASDELRAHQIVGDMELLPEPPSSDKINQVAGTFVDPVTFKKTDFPAVIVAEWVEEDGGQPLIEDLDLRCVTSEHQAQRLANIILRQRRNARTLTCSVNLSGWRYRPGQTIKVYIPALGIQGPEFRVSDWAFSLNNGVDLTLREDSPLFWADAIGKPMTRPEITELPTGGVAMPDLLRYELEQMGEILQGVLSWRNTGTVAYNQVIVQRLAQGVAPVTVMTAQVPGQSCRVNGLAAGNYAALVRAVALTGAHSPVAAVNFTIAVPATPVGVEVEAGNWSLALRPLFAGGHDFSVLCEWWWSHIDHPLGEAMAKAIHAGIASYMTLQGLRPDTEYFVWLRAVNAYGKSGLLAARARTSYDAASILDVLDGEIGAEHLREELRNPIELIPGISEELTDLGGVVADIRPIVDRVPVLSHELAELDATLVDLDQVVGEIKPIAERVPEISHELTNLGGALSALDDRSKQAEALLRDEQLNLGSMGIDNVLQQDKLHSKLDRVQAEMGDLRDAIFTVNPGTGEIEMDAVRALRDETHASFTEVNQKLDAASGTIATKADHAVVDAQWQRLTEAEQLLDGVNAKLTQTVTKSEFAGEQQRLTLVSSELDAVKGSLDQAVTKEEFSDEQQRLTSVSNSLDATKGELAQKAAQSTVTAQGERLAVAEQRITATSDANSVMAAQVSGLKAQLEQDDKTLQANITDVARVSADADQVLALRVSGVETRTDTAEGKIRVLEEVVEDAGGITAGRFDEIAAALDLAARAADQAAEAGVANALAGEQGEQRHRQAEASIRHDQKVQLDLHQALAREVTELDARFEGEKAATAANFTEVREVVAGVEQSAVQQISQLKADYQAGDRQTNAALEERSKTLSDADKALSERVTQLQATLAQDDQTLNAAILETQRTQAQGDQALAEQIGQLQTASGEQSSSLTNLAQVVSDGQQATGQALQQLNTKTDQTNASVGGLSEAVSEQGKALAGKQDELAAEVDLAALAGLGNTLADEEGETRNRKARAQITQRQEAQANEHQALAREVTQFRAEFAGAAADTAAELTEVREVIAGVEQSTAQQITQLKTEYQEGDRQTNAALQQTSKTLSDADKALSERVTNLQATLEQDDQTLNAAILETQRTQTQGDQTLAEQISQLRTEYQAADSQTTAALQQTSKTLSDADKALSERVTQLQATLAQDDQTLNAAILETQRTQAQGDQALAEQIGQLQTASGEQSSSLTNLAQVVSDGQQATGQALQQLNTKTDQTNASVGGLSEAVSEQGKALAGKQDELAAEVDLAALAGLGNTLADEEGETRNRKARAQITQRQEAQANEHQALAREVTQFRAEFAGAAADTAAELTEVREVIAGVEQSTAQQITQLKTEYQEGDRQTNAALQQTSKTLSDADLAMGQRVDTVQAQVTQQGQTLSSAVQSEQQARTDADSALGLRVDTVQAQVTQQGQTLSSAVQSEQQARTDADRALGQRVDTVQAQVTQQGQTLSAAVQTVAEAQADTAGKVSAGWYTKAQVNGEGGGFGLSVTLNADGSVLSSFVIDADVFAVLSRAAGVTSKRNPFVVKNGTVYMNHALMDTAEIGNVIAKYINVQHLVGALVEGGSFRGGDLWLGENPNGSFGAYGKRWNAGIDSNGRIYGSGVYFESGTFQGNVLANSGTMNNVTIRENCQILGNLSAAQITGDIVRVYDASNQAQINLGSSAYGRDIAFSMIANSGRDTTTVTAWVNGVAVRQFQARITDVAGTISSNTVTGSHTMYLPAGQNHVVQFTWSGSGGNNSASCTIIVSKH